MQDDAHECLTQIYQNFNDYIFTVSYLELVHCIGSTDGSIQGCMQELNRIVNNMYSTLELNNSVMQDILSLTTQSQRSKAPLGYRCGSCSHKNPCDKVDLISG